MKILTLLFLTLMSTHVLTGNDILDVARDSGKFKILLAAAQEAGLSSALQGAGPLTIFAPNDEAFGKLPEGTVEDLLKTENKKKLIAILKLHIIPAKFEAKDVINKELISLNGETLKAYIKGGQLYVNKAKLIANDISASNGIIHIIDRVLLPAASLNNAEKMTQIIESAINKGVPLYNHGQHQACVDVYSLALESLVLWDDNLIEAELKSSIKNSLKNTQNNHKAGKNAWVLRKLLDKVYGEINNEKQKEKMMSNFKPIIESKMPKGFPKPGPLGELVVKNYPEYRMARAESGGQNSTFMKLFFHIQKSGIGMTSPVEMTLDDKDQSRENMAFIYANKEIGELGDRGNGVNVYDMPAKTYLSLGIRGSQSKEKISDAIEEMKAYLLKNQQWQLDGEARLLGYNSPMVPQENRYWEVQLPVIGK
ncbi:heme-binding protein [Lentisphaera marina]|uniref:heme-binding protein n=1 Tax=Lentisphaera marina TaxID=1111041 RepID=UPI0023664F75|nr:heme-binding protein [Lentisphaera marina]MDD7986054.1 heme-binding protein [Lentisphaera marina]